MNEELKGSYKYLNKNTTDYIQKINGIIESLGMPLTVRQIYYQFRVMGYFRDVEQITDVTDQIKQLKKRYNRVQGACAIGRKRDLIQWDMIRDTSRPEHPYYSYVDLKDWLETVKGWTVDLDPWKDSEYQMEVWTEKDAMTSIIKPIAEKWRMGFYVTRGFQSLTQLWKAECRETENMVILYLGDHDPSGLCIDESIKEFFEEREVTIEFRRVALTKQQAEELKILHEPCNPADKRTEKYVKKYGDKAWELDAISPNKFPNYIEERIDEIVKEYADFKPEDADKEDESVTEEFKEIIQEDINEMEEDDNEETDN